MSKSAGDQVASLGETARDLVALTKPRVTALVVATFGGGLWLAPGHFIPARTLLALLGIVMVVGAANALNMFWERDTDGLMARTRSRPLPQGRMRPETALVWGILLAAFALPLLQLTGNPLTAGLGLLAFALYVFAYTPLKQKSWMALIVGAVPGALPPLMGWTAATGRISAPGAVLFAILFFWQIPHFLAIAVYRSSEYERAGIRVLSLVGQPRTLKVATVGGALALVGSTLLLRPLGVVSAPFTAVAVALGVVFLAYSLGVLAPTAGRKWARSLFVVSILYLTALFVALAVMHVRA